MTSGTRRHRRTLGVHAVLAIGAALMVTPFAWMILTSLKTLDQATRVPPIIFPPHLHWENYANVTKLLPFGEMYLNTVLMSFGRTAGQLVVCSLAAYAFARIDFPGRGLLFLVALSTLMVPFQVYLIPQYLLMRDFGWLDTRQALIVPGLFSAFATFLLRQYFLTLPKELEEAARLDGAGHLRIYWQMILPLAKPALVALSILTLLWSWNDLLWPLIVINSPDKMTLSAGLASLQGQYLTDFPALMAGSVLAIWPMIAVFFLLQRQFIEGVALTGSKA